MIKDDKDIAGVVGFRDLNEENSGSTFVDYIPDSGIESDRREGEGDITPLDIGLVTPENKLSPQNQKMLLNSLGKIENSAGIIATIIRDLEHAPAWAESKIYIAADNLDSVSDYMENEREAAENESEEDSESVDDSEIDKDDLGKARLDLSNSDDVVFEEFMYDYGGVGKGEHSRIMKAVGDTDPTNFPFAGEDLKVSLRNSDYPIFDLDFAEKIKTEYPDIWDLGGNVLGNKQFNRLVPVARRGGNVETEIEERAVRLREAWSARHYKDFRIAGVIAQIKWLTIGEKGEQYMKDLVKEEIDRKENRSKLSEAMRAEPITSCPLPTTNLELNIKNRNEAIDLYMYGPANPDLDDATDSADINNEDYWNEIAEVWDESPENAKSMRCGNCAFFDVRSGIKDCIKSGFDDQGKDIPDSVVKDLGYCRAHDFKCHKLRTCVSWVAGGPIKDDSDSSEGDAQADKDPVSELSMEENMSEKENTIIEVAAVDGVPQIDEAVLNAVVEDAELELKSVDSSLEEEGEETQPIEKTEPKMAQPKARSEKDFTVNSVKRNASERVYTMSGQKRAVFGVKDLTVRAVYEDGSEADTAEERSRMGRPPKFYSIEGIASSTSVDHYGTEMTYKALFEMQEQFVAGVPVLPRHQSILADGMAEWDEVIGRTDHAEIRMVAPQEMGNAFDYGENQYVLAVRSRLYGDDEKARELVRRLDRGEPIGQSIGGWFNKMEVVENAEGEISRIMVEEVSLDHLAITRAPANPDSFGLASIRSAIGGFSNDAVAAVKSVPSEMQRHIAEIVDEGGQLVIRFDKSEDFEGIFFTEGGNKVTAELVQPEEELVQPEEEKDNHLPEEQSTVVMRESDELSLAENVEETQKDNTKPNIDQPNLDNCVIVDEDNNERALRTTPDEEYQMKEQDFAKIADLMRSAIAPLNERIKDLETTVETPVAVVEERSVNVKTQEAPAQTPENSALLKELERTRSLLNEVMSEPVRMGRHSTTHIRGIGATSAYSELISRSRADGAVALSSIAEQNIDVLANEVGTDQTVRSQHDLIDLLSKGLRAAEIDGLLGTKQATNWN